MPIEKSWDVAEGLAARLSAARASGIDDSKYWGPAWHHIQDLLEPQKLTRPPAGKEWFVSFDGRMLAVKTDEEGDDGPYEEDAQDVDSGASEQCDTGYGYEDAHEAADSASPV